MVVFFFLLFFFKIYRKCLCKNLGGGVPFLIKLTEESFITITTCNFTTNGPQHGFLPANLEKFLKFLPEDPQPNTFVPFRPL